MKKCARCGQEKSLEDFYRDVRFDDGRLRGTCKECMSNRRPKAVVVPAEKECSKCGQVKPASEFLADSRHADGLRAECKSCFYSNDRYDKSQEWRHANPDKIRKYNKSNAAKRTEYDRKNPEMRATIGQRRRARKQGNGPNDFTEKQWQLLKVAYGFRCAYCGKKPKVGPLTIEHIIPLAKGGPNTASNILPACKSCNSSKTDNAAPTHQPHFLA